MTRRQLPIIVGGMVLMFGILACTCLGSGTPIGGFQATANAALTQAAVGVATAGAVGNSLKATANAEATSALATANAANSGTTGGQPTATVETSSGPTATEATSGQPTPTKVPASQPTAVATTAGAGGNITGGPKDIPIVDGQNTLLLASDQLVSYQTQVDFASVVKFYKDAMPKNGWTADATGSVETSNATVLSYKKDNRQALVSITSDPTSKQTVVLITIQ